MALRTVSNGCMAISVGWFMNHLLHVREHRQRAVIVMPNHDLAEDLPAGVVGECRLGLRERRSSSILFLRIIGSMFMRVDSKCAHQLRPPLLVFAGA